VNVFLRPTGLHSRAMLRVADALERYAPSQVCVVRDRHAADLVVSHVIGFDEPADRPEAIIQYCWRTARGSRQQWIDRWSRARLVWSYYDLPALVGQNGFPFYHAPLGVESDRALMDAFKRIAEVEEEFHELDVEGRIIPYRHRAGGVVWFDFRVICGWGRSQHDYLDLSRRFHTVTVSGVPRMGLALAEEARRFTLMVDVFYDNRVKLIVSAETSSPRKLLKIEEDPGDARLRAMVFEFDRTASRLVEMQSREYLAERRRAPE